MYAVATTTPPEILGLLADPPRWQLVVELGRSDRRVGELVQLAGKSQNLASYHLGELRQAGIVSARRRSADGRDVYRAELHRCRDLLGALCMVRRLNHGIRRRRAGRPSQDLDAPSRSA